MSVGWYSGVGKRLTGDIGNSLDFPSVLDLSMPSETAFIPAFKTFESFEPIASGREASSRTGTVLMLRPGSPTTARVGSEGRDGSGWPDFGSKEG